MSGAAQSGPATSERSERKGSWGRALEKLRAALRRRRSSGQDVLVKDHGTGAEETRVIVQDSANRIVGIATSAPETIGETPPAEPSTTIECTSLAVDETLAEDNDEPLVPVVNRRTGMDADKARALFARHGLSYEPRRSSDGEPAPKMRRVEKPIRVRLHYRCHECQGHFAKNKSCTKCGHRRCAECTRQPAKGVQELMESGRQAMAEEGRSISIVDWATKVTSEPAVAPPSEVAGISSHPLEKDDAVEGDMDLSRHPLFLPHARPRSGQELIQRPKTQIIRRACHKCETQFLPPSRTDCANCQHTRCTLCPRWPTKADKWRDGSPGDLKAPAEEVHLVQSVQRVLRKPRMRVRYTCDQCQAVFVDRHTCQSCGHMKCAGCSRNPRKRTSQPDPAVLQSVDDRLTAFQALESPRTVATVAG